MLDRHKRRWDSTCPNCRRDFAIESQWNYETEFVTECPHCECRLHVEVVSVPEFGIMKLDEFKRLEKEHLERIKGGKQ